MGLVLVLWTLGLGTVVAADEAESLRLSKPALIQGLDGNWTIEADVQVTLNSVLIDALKRGVPLVFVAEFDIFKKRWYWFDEKLLSQHRPVRLAYHAITQQYRITHGDQISTFPTLDEALAAALHLKQWTLAPTQGELSLSDRIGEIKKTPDAYELRLRMRLDSSQLPKPLQVNALTNRDWNLSSDWVRPRLVMAPAPTPGPSQ